MLLQNGTGFKMISKYRNIDSSIVINHNVDNNEFSLYVSPTLNNIDVFLDEMESLITYIKDDLKEVEVVVEKVVKTKQREEVKQEPKVEETPSNDININDLQLLIKNNPQLLQVLQQQSQPVVQEAVLPQEQSASNMKLSGETVTKTINGLTLQIPKEMVDYKPTQSVPTYAPKPFYASKDIIR